MSGQMISKLALVLVAHISTTLPLPVQGGQLPVALPSELMWEPRVEVCSPKQCTSVSSFPVRSPLVCKRIAVQLAVAIQEDLRGKKGQQPPLTLQPSCVSLRKNSLDA